MQPGIAAGNPATAAAGDEILANGGNAADAAVAATLASCVAESIMTGLLGGGHAIYFDAASGQSWNLDCFCSIPSGEGGELTHLEVPFGEEHVHYAIGAASFAVPGVAAGVGALHQRFGRLPWPDVFEPAIRLARGGVPMSPAHASCLAMLAPIMTMDAGERIYAPENVLLQAGDTLRQPGIEKALSLLVAEGAASMYTGSLAQSVLSLMRARGGIVTADDLREYEAIWSEPLEVDYAGYRVLTRGGLSKLPDLLPRLARLRGLSETERVLQVVRVLDVRGAETHTTNVSVVDDDGNACAFTSSLGLGSGDFLPGLDVHLNSMLGEVDLQVRPLEPGARMESMMSPTLVLDDHGLAVAAGSAGGTRLRPALVQVLSGILDEGLAPQEAVDRPRLHSAAEIVRIEPGFAEAALAALEEAGYDVRRFSAIHHYFGGVSLLARSGGAADPRRSGKALALR